MDRRGLRARKLGTGRYQEGLYLTSSTAAPNPIHLPPRGTPTKWASAAQADSPPCLRMDAGCVSISRWAGPVSLDVGRQKAPEAEWSRIRPNLGF